MVSPLSCYRSFLFQLASLVLASTLSLVGSAVADERFYEASDVTIFVRTIEATDPIKGDLSDAAEEPVVRVDAALEDLQPKLAQLPFSSFKLLASKQEHVSLRKRQTLHLPNGQSLVLRPMYVDHKRVGVWLNWKDTGGTDILNTRIHFDADDSVLTGTDCPHDAGLILAIKAVPLSQ
jgi:hypothetical protein